MAVKMNRSNIEGSFSMRNLWLVLFFLWIIVMILFPSIKPIQSVSTAKNFIQTSSLSP